MSFSRQPAAEKSGDHDVHDAAIIEGIRTERNTKPLAAMGISTRERACRFSTDLEVWETALWVPPALWPP